MLPIFTDPYPDELFYSALSRYEKHIYDKNLMNVLSELFGKNTIIPSYYLASNLEHLCSILHGYSPEEIIDDHTVYPYYKPFIQNYRQQKLTDQMLRGNCEGIYITLGLRNTKIFSIKEIRYCKKCAADDMKIYGEPYIHREHQLQGILICPHHHEYLITYKYGSDRISRLKYVALEEKNLDVSNKIYDFSSNEYDILCKLSDMAYSILKTNYKNFSCEQIYNKYLVYLSKKGFCTFAGEVNQKQLAAEMINYYGANLLDKLDCNIDVNYDYDWLKVITRKNKRTARPIKHLLLINYLVDNIDEFFESNIVSSGPFGDGPWPCLNKVCVNYNKHVINSVTITKDTKTSAPVGTFSCDCGFIYARRGPDKSTDDIYRIGKTKEYGLNWINKLKEFLSENKYSSRKLSDIMGCDANTIRKKALELGYNCFINNSNTLNNSKHEISDEISPKIDEYKKIVLEFIENNKELKRQDILIAKAKEYRYLCNKDKKWISDILDDIDKKFDYDSIEVNHNNSKVNWIERDYKYVDLIQKKYEEILSRRPFEKVTKSKIGKELHISNDLYNNISKIPMTDELLNSIVESSDDYMRRKITELIKYNDNEQMMWPIWKIRKMAGVSVYEYAKIIN